MQTALFGYWPGEVVVVEDKVAQTLDRFHQYYEGRGDTAVHQQQQQQQEINHVSYYKNHASTVYQQKMKTKNKKNTHKKQ